MISKTLFSKTNLSIWVLALVLTLISSPASTQTVYDPFCQSFQVGTFSDPDALELEQGFPADLLEPAFVDTIWTNNAMEILAQPATTDSPHLVLRLLAGMADNTASESWLRWHRLRIEQLISWQDSLATGGRYLLAERLSLGFFHALEKEDWVEARRLANRLGNPNSMLGLPEREIFVWGLREYLLTKKFALSAESEPTFWNSLLTLGSFDFGNGWALWTAHQRESQKELLPQNLLSKTQATKLASLRQSWLQESDLEASAFSSEIKAGLGAKLLKKEQLQSHLSRYQRPPVDFRIQGWWVSGMRASHRGQTAFYSELASRPDLKPGWRMDLFRRASEIHLLKGRWEPGLENLRNALELASTKAGTPGQRKRLRQWVEQALVLAVAQNRNATARTVHDLGYNAFSGSELSTFETETMPWQEEIGWEKTSAKIATNRKEKARLVVKSGAVQTLEASNQQTRQLFLKASQTPLWNLWARWGLALAKENLKQTEREHYRNLLLEIQQTREAEIQEDLVVLAVSSLLAKSLEKETLLRWALDKDIHHRSHGRSLVGMSPMSGLAKKKLTDHLALHAMLGLALLADDLRGIVGVATPLPPSGLTNEEKLCFLYPLARDGSIHQALAAASNDPALLLAVARNESLFEPSVRSRAGALGWMQIMPFHLSQKGARPGSENWSNAQVSIAKGDALLKENRHRYQGNPYLTLAAYNAGPGATARWQKQLGDNTRNDIFLAWIGYPETRHYVEKVLIDREIYDWIIGESRLTP